MWFNQCNLGFGPSTILVQNHSHVTSTLSQKSSIAILPLRKKDKGWIIHANRLCYFSKSLFEKKLNPIHNYFCFYCIFKNELSKKSLKFSETVPSVPFSGASRRKSCNRTPSPPPLKLKSCKRKEWKWNC